MTVRVRAIFCTCIQPTQNLTHSWQNWLKNNGLQHGVLSVFPFAIHSVMDLFDLFEISVVTHFNIHKSNSR